MPGAGALETVEKEKPPPKTSCCEGPTQKPHCVYTASGVGIQRAVHSMLGTNWLPALGRLAVAKWLWFSVCHDITDIHILLGWRWGLMVVLPPSSS